MTAIPADRRPPKPTASVPGGRRRAARRLAMLAAVALAAACGVDGARTGGPPSGGVPVSTIAPAVPPAPDTKVAASPAAPYPRVAKWIDLAVGDCLADPPPGDPSVVTVTVVDCAAAHAAEVYARAPVAVDAATAEIANRECAAAFTGYTGRSADAGPLTFTYLIDSDQDRTGANPAPSTVICLLQAANDQPLTGSARH